LYATSDTLTVAPTQQVDAAMPRFIFLLRGDIVFGANIVRMAEFRAFLSGIGVGNVEIYFESGNAVFTSKETAAVAILRLFTQAFATRFGFAPKMMVLTEKELAAAIAGNLFMDPGVDPARLHLGFKADAPSVAAVEAVAAKPQNSEEYQIKGRVFYLHSPDGVGKSKFFEGLDRMLKAPVTFRNWHTVLSELATKSAI
jgi:uncharacterized protein (DUF1697 family)